jgi:hypothetical protein
MVPAILPAKVRVKSYETFVPILKLNETKLDISKESTKKGSEAILEQPQENTFENVEEDMLQSISKSKSKPTSKLIAKSTSKSASI